MQHEKLHNKLYEGVQKSDTCWLVMWPCVPQQNGEDCKVQLEQTEVCSVFSNWVLLHYYLSVILSSNQEEFRIIIIVVIILITLTRETDYPLYH